jgi:uncharacterized protein YgiB involved in biofilm formation
MESDMHSLTRSLTLSALGAAMLFGLAACGDDEKTTVVHEKPIIVQPSAGGGVTPGTVEQMCPNGYNNATRSCY